MSREWLNQSDNPAMSEWAFEANDLFAGVMIVDLATPTYRVALSGDFEAYTPVTDGAQMAELRVLDQENPGYVVAIEAAYDEETRTPAQLTYLVAANGILTYERFRNT